ncbi:MAG: KxYKxGKxW signal peptide domain-containing protein [Lachnospiraceae bacterium]|nr:KxYKxGKxW signal peptide domain-containing protein [Lachnospiraceae bacterium]
MKMYKSGKNLCTFMGWL